MTTINISNNAFFDGIDVKYINNLKADKLKEMGNFGIDYGTNIKNDSKLVYAEKDNQILGVSIINVENNNLIIDEYTVPNLDQKVEESLKFVLATASVAINEEENELYNRVVNNISVNVNGKPFSLNNESISIIKNKAQELYDKNSIKSEAERKDFVENNEEQKKEREAVINELDENKANDLHGNGVSYMVNGEKNPTIIETEYSNLNDEIKSSQEKSLQDNKDFDAKKAFEQESKNKVNIDLVDIGHVQKEKLNEEELKVYMAAASIIGNNVKVNLERGIIMEEKGGELKMNTANYKSNGNINVSEVDKNGDSVEQKVENNITPEIVSEMKENGIDLNNPKYRGMEQQICESYGYNFDPNKKMDNSTNANTNNYVNTNSYVKRLTFKNPNSGQAAYVDALVLSLVTGIFGGIFLTILFMTIK